jgi:Leucine-rich repeat (LRR) protein
MIGSISSKILEKLINCKRISLANNNISGEFLRELATLGQLEYVNLSSNNMSGQIFSEYIENLQYLTFLDLSFNEFHGKIPNIFDKVALLTHLNLSGNNFTGPIPDTLSHLTKLVTLKMYSNALTGPLPDGLSSLSLLADINFSQNNLTGDFHMLQYCQYLKSINFSYNKLDCELNISKISHLRYLEVLYLQCNSLSGTISEDIVHLQALRFLNLSDNIIGGIVPSTMGYMNNTCRGCHVIDADRFKSEV